MNQDEAAVQESHRKYWQSNLRILGSLLAIWFSVSYGCGILFKETLDKFSVGGAPFGFWMAQQGSIYVYVVLIFIYLKMMDKLDHKYHHDEKDILAEESRNNE